MSFKISKYADLVWKNEKGQFHREKGPALIYTDGAIEYLLNGKFHRLNGPAEIFSYGSKYYWVHGKRYSKAEYYSKVKEL